MISNCNDFRCTVCEKNFNIGHIRLDSGKKYCPACIEYGKKINIELNQNGILIYDGITFSGLTIILATIFLFGGLISLLLGIFFSMGFTLKCQPKGLKFAITLALTFLIIIKLFVCGISLLLMHKI